MKYTLFEHLNNLTTEKLELDPLDDDQVKSYDPYMTNRFISMTQMYVLLVNEINRYDVPKEAHYNYFLSTLPKRKQYFKYIGKPKKDDIETITRISKYYEIGKREAKQYIDFLSDEQVKEIYQKYETK